MKYKLQSVVTGEDLYSLIYKCLQEDVHWLPVYPGQNKHPLSSIESKSYESVPDQMKSTSLDAVHVQKLIELYNGSLTGNETDAVVVFITYTDICSEETLLSLLYAIVYRKKFLYLADYNQLTSLLLRNELQSVFLILPYSAMDFSFTYRIEELNKFVGFLPYKDKDSILNYLFNRITLDTKIKAEAVYLLLNRIQTKNDCEAQHVFNGGLAYYFPKGQCDLAHLEHLMTSSTNVVELNYIAHSRECSVVMDDFLFCGYENASKQTFNDRHYFLPSCYYNGELCYTSNRKRLSTTALHAKVLFLNGCNIGDLDSSCIPYDFTVIKHLIEGNSLSITTSPSIKTGDVVENILAHNLLKYGFTEGEKVYYLNKFLLRTGIENNLYYQIGDPSFSYEMLKPITAHIDFKNMQNLDLQITRIQNETFFEVKIMNLPEGSDIHINQCKLYFENGNADRKSVIYYHIADSPTENEKVCMFFSKNPFEAVSMNIIFTFDDPIIRKLKYIQEYNLNLEFFKDISKIPSHLKGRLEDLQNQYIHIHQASKEHKFNILTRTKMLEAIRNMEDKYKKLSKELFNTIKSYTEKHSDSFFETISEKRKETEPIQFKTVCRECGKITGEFSYTLFTYAGPVRRTSFKCMQCGGISDVADTSIRFTGRSDIRFESGGWNDVIYSIENQNDFPVDLTAAVICIDTKELDIELEQPEFTIEPHQKIDFKVRITPNNLLQRGYYLFSFYFMGNTRFYYFSKMIGYVNLNNGSH